MTVAFRSVSTTGFTNTAQNTTTCTISKPTGTLDGDFLVAIIAATNPPTAAPAGWSLVAAAGVVKATSNSRYNNNYLYTYTKVASAEPASWTWTMQAHDVNAACCLAYIGAGNFVDIIATGQSSGLSKNPTSYGNSKVGKYPNEVLLRIGAAEIVEVSGNMPTSYTTLAGYIKRVNINYHYNGGYKQDAFYGNCMNLTVQEITADFPAPSNLLWTLDKNAQCTTDILISIPSGNSPPTVSNIAPYDQYKYDIAATPTFAWLFQDVDTGDVQQSYALRRKIGAGAYEWYNAGAGTWGSTEFFNTSAQPWITFPAAKWVTATTYLWSVSVKDNHGAQSAYSTDTTVIGLAGAPTVTVTQPETPYRGLQAIVAWTNTAGTQGPVRVKIFDAPTVAAATFQPDLSSPLWSGLTIASSSLTVGIPATAGLLPGKQYYAYVLATDGAVAANPLAPNSWASRAFVIDLDQSTPPGSLSATPTAGDARGPRVDVFARRFSNLLTADQSSVIAGVTGWKNLTNFTLAVGTTALYGSESLRLTAAATATATACTLEGSAGIPVLAGASYKAFYSTNPSATRSPRAGIRWYDISGNLISTSFGATSGATLNVWTQTLSVTANAPANAVWAAVVVDVAATAGDVYFIDGIFFGSGSVAPNVWSSGGRVYGNLLTFDDSTFESGIDAITNYINPDSNLTLARSTANPRSGSLSLLGTAQFGGNATQPPIGSADIVSPQVPVFPVNQYTASAWIRPSANRNFTVSIDWYLADGTTLISTTTCVVTALTSGSYQQLFVYALSPALAKLAAVRITFVNPTLADTVNVDDVCLTQGLTTMSGVGGITIPTLLEANYSDDAGITWQKVRNLSSVVATPTPDVSASDFEVPNATTRQYRIRERSQIADFPIASVVFPLLSGSYVSAPDSIGVSVSADFDIRILVAADNWVPAAEQVLMAKYEPIGNQRSWRLSITTAGNLLLTISTNGTATTTYTSSVVTSLVNGTAKWVRATYQASDGANSRVKFYLSDDGLTWTQLGADVTGAINSIFDSSAALTIGAAANLGTDSPLSGSVFYAEFRNGINGGGVLTFDPTQAVDASTTVASVSTLTDLYGNVFTLMGQASWAPNVTDMLVTIWSAVVSAVGVGTGDWWLKDPQDPTKNMKLFIEGGAGGDAIGFKSTTTNAVFDVLGRPDWVVITDTYKYDKLTFKSLLFATDFAAFEVLRKSLRTLLLQSDYGPQYYVQFESRHRGLINTNAEFQEIEVDLTQVARPAVV